MPVAAGPAASASRTGLGLLLGLLTAFGPMSIDMYLPTFPAIARELGTSIGAVQYTLAAYMGGLALGQLLYGPLADQYGRKPMLLAGLALYAVAAVGCAASPTVGSLVGWRVGQAVGGGAGAVLGFAIVRDGFAGNEAARLFSLLLLVMGVAPILAPTVGGLLVAHASWRLIFGLLAALAALALLGVALGLRETLPPARRNPRAVRGAWRTCRALLRDRAFVGFALDQQFHAGRLTFTAVYALDGFGDSQCSWVIEDGERRILHGGDTLWHSYFWSLGARYQAFDAVFLPINGVAVHMPHLPLSPVPATLTPLQAVSAAQLLSARQLVPVHFGLNLPGFYEEYPGALAETTRQATELGVPLTVLENGQLLSWPSQARPPRPGTQRAAR